MRYTVQKCATDDPAIHAPEWEGATLGRIDKNRWGDFEKAPETVFKMLRCPNGFALLMHTVERHLRAEIVKENGMVCTDSCMEFFFKPDNHDVNYLNFECNPRGVMYLSIGAGRHGRTLLDDREIFHIESRAVEGDWSLKLFIPDSFILSHFAKISSVCRGNFYKCGDLTDHEHYAAWNEVEVPQPDFHVPDFFGYIEL